MKIICNLMLNSELIINSTLAVIIFIFFQELVNKHFN